MQMLDYLTKASLKTIDPQEAAAIKGEEWALFWPEVNLHHDGCGEYKRAGLFDYGWNWAQGWRWRWKK
ncbi:MAG: hypothetical protein CMM42_17560 [Rhodospirillaceae bacterium]|nr:hypothetical protein [Rhodospirillaceae bacterium]